MRKLALGIVVIVLAIGLVGCNPMGDIELNAGDSGIYIEDDGAISYGSCEKFDKKYYNEDQLENDINTEVSDFNKSKHSSVDDACSIEQFKVNSEEAKLVLDFVTTYDFKNYMLNYAGFEPEGFYIGPISDNDKCDIKGTFVKPHSKKTVTAKEVKKMKDCILITYTPFKVQVNGDIKCISSNCKIDEDDVVSTSPNKGELSYIVYDIED
ncbi:MAG: hypothetical protein K6E58_01355 [Eubacterium sp.]|nr:hypothetical protein [Eubacterium sp.]